MIYSAVLKLNERRKETALESDQNGMSDFCNLSICFMLFVPCMFLQSTYHPTYTFCEVPFMTYINSYMFWRRYAIRGVIIAKVCKPTCQHMFAPPYRNDRNL